MAFLENLNFKYVYNIYVTLFISLPRTLIKSDILQVAKQIFLGGFRYCKWPGALYQHQILIIWNPFYDLLCADNKTQSSALQQTSYLILKATTQSLQDHPKIRTCFCFSYCCNSESCQISEILSKLLKISH